MSTVWGKRKAGSLVIEGDEEGVLILADVPDHVRLPPELGGTQHKVKQASLRECPCRAGHQAKTFELEGTGIHVSECTFKGFLWWKPR